jgi:hypothetical protein
MKPQTTHLPVVRFGDNRYNRKVICSLYLRAKLSRVAFVSPKMAVKGGNFCKIAKSCPLNWRFSRRRSFHTYRQIIQKLLMCMFFC